MSSVEPMALTGDWKGVERYLDSFERRLLREIDRATADNLAMVESEVVRNLKGQKLPWPPLSEPYRRAKLRRKKGRRLSEKTLIATGKMMQSITSEQENPFTGVVGVKKTARYRGGARVANIAAVHEFGTRDRRIPPRPLWGPTAEQVEEHVLDRYDQAMRKVVNG